MPILTFPLSSGVTPPTPSTELWVTPRTFDVPYIVGYADLEDFLTTDLTYLYAPPSCKVRRTSSQSIASLDPTPTVVLWQAEDWDSGGLWSVGDPGALVASRGGQWVVRATLVLSLGSGTSDGLYLRVNGTTIYAMQTLGTGPDAISGSEELELTAGDEVEILLDREPIVEARRIDGGTGLLNPKSCASMRWVSF